MGYPYPNFCLCAFLGQTLSTVSVRVPVKGFYQGYCSEHYKTLAI